jgi:hypothetical protein
VSTNDNRKSKKSNEENKTLKREKTLRKVLKEALVKE